MCIYICSQLDELVAFNAKGVMTHLDLFDQNELLNLD